MADYRPIAIEARIAGRVQGVWFRGWAREESRRLALTGWVRNESDGSVKALFVGRAEAVETMLALCRDGPPLARVDRVDVMPVAPAPVLSEFRVER